MTLVIFITNAPSCYFARGGGGQKKFARAPEFALRTEKLKKFFSPKMMRARASPKHSLHVTLLKKRELRVAARSNHTGQQKLEVALTKLYAGRVRAIGAIGAIG